MTQFPTDQLSFLRFSRLNNSFSATLKPLNQLSPLSGPLREDSFTSIPKKWNQMDKFSSRGEISIPLFPKQHEQEFPALAEARSYTFTKSLCLPELKIHHIDQETPQRSPFASLINYKMNELPNLMPLEKDIGEEESSKKQLHSKMLSQSKKIAKYLSESRLGNKNGFYSKNLSQHEEASQRSSNRHRNKRNPWKPSEDMKLLDLVKVYGECWAMISSKMNDRTGKQIRDRYLNILRPNLKKGEWNQNEDFLLVSLYYSFGHKWSLIAKHMPGRSEAQVKNRFYSHVKKRLSSDFPKELKIPRFIADDEEVSPPNSTEHDENSHQTKLEEREEIKIESSISEPHRHDIKREEDNVAEKNGDYSHIVKEHTRRYKEIFRRTMMKKNHNSDSPHQAVAKNEARIPINEKEVDMVLGILAHYYEGNPQPTLDPDHVQRLQQLNTRKNQLEFLLSKTLQEMKKLQSSS
jgi:hypothetical protein